jgi:hypothetical protein
MERRELIKIFAITALSPKLNALQTAVCHMEAAAKTSNAPEYKLQLFSQDESRVLDQLMEMIVPADNHSPGAHAAKTNLFADLMVATSDDAVKKQWRDGIRLVQKEAAGSSLVEALRKAATNEENPKTELEQNTARM